MLKCKATNGKGDTIKDNVEDKTDEVMLNCNFSEGVDGSEGKETILSLFLSSQANILYVYLHPRQDHDRTGSARSKSIKGQYGQEQERVFKQDLVSSA